MYKNRMEKITIRCTSDEKEMIRKKASRCDLTLSDYCRERCLGGNNIFYRKKDRNYLRTAVDMQKSLNGLYQAVLRCPIDDEVVDELVFYTEEIREGVDKIWQFSLT